VSAQIDEEPAVEVAVPPEPGGLHRPWRALVALAELIGAAAAIWGAFLCWPRGVATITLVLDDGTRLVSTRYFGNWMAAAIALGTVAALLVLDAVRQVILAVRTTPRRGSRHAASS
jgi:hypothetical protein